MSPTLKAHFADYSAFHGTPGNQACHYVGIPLIVLTLFAMLAKVPLADVGGFALTLAEVLFAAVTVYYLTLDPPLALAMLARLRGARRGRPAHPVLARPARCSCSAGSFSSWATTSTRSAPPPSSGTDPPAGGAALDPRQGHRPDLSHMSQPDHRRSWVRGRARGVRPRAGRPGRMRQRPRAAYDARGIAARGHVLGHAGGRHAEPDHGARGGRPRSPLDLQVGLRGTARGCSWSSRPAASGSCAAAPSVEPPFLDISASDQRGRRAGPARPGLPPPLRDQRPLLRQLHGPRGRHADLGVPHVGRRTRTWPTRPASGSCCSWSSPSPTTTAAGSRSATTASSTSGWATAAPGATPSATARTWARRSGKMLRIDVDRGSPFAVPARQPVRGAARGAFPAVWAFGLRNPWRFSFDRTTGDLYIGDVGQNALEEVDVGLASRRGGENYGWNVTEGDRCFRPARGCDRTGQTAPVLVYGRDSRLLDHGRRRLPRLPDAGLPGDVFLRRLLHGDHPLVPPPGRGRRRPAGLDGGPRTRRRERQLVRGGRGGRGVHPRPLRRRGVPRGAPVAGPAERAAVRSRSPWPPSRPPPATPPVRP